MARRPAATPASPSVVTRPPVPAASEAAADGAILAPSAHNSQPWQVVLREDPLDRRAAPVPWKPDVALAPLAPAFLRRHTDRCRFRYARLPDHHLLPALAGEAAPTGLVPVVRKDQVRSSRVRECAGRHAGVPAP